MPLTIASRTEKPVERTKPDTQEAYIRMYEGRAERYISGKTDVLPSMVFAGIRCFNRLDFEKIELEKAHSVERLTSGMLAKLTPRQLLNTFPPTKSFDGQKYQSKDYLSTMEAVRAVPLDEPIGDDRLFELLWDYVNPDVSTYMVQRMTLTDQFLKYQGKPSVLESLFVNQGIAPRYLRTGPDGKEYLYDPDTDTTTRVYPKRPFKVVSRNLNRVNRKGYSRNADHAERTADPNH